MRVFRCGDFVFPPSRGRTTLVLSDDGTAEVQQPGPTDRPETTTGRWEVRGEEIHVEVPNWNTVLRIESLDDEMLVARQD